MNDFMKLAILAVCFGVSLLLVISTINAFGFVCGVVVCMATSLWLTYLVDKFSEV